MGRPKTEGNGEYFIAVEAAFGLLGKGDYFDITHDVLGPRMKDSALFVREAGDEDNSERIPCLGLLS